METVRDDLTGPASTLPPPMPRIVVVDDEEPIRRLLVQIIAPRYPECAEAGDVAAARRLLAESRCDILLLDLALADGSGMALLDQPLPPETVVVVITGQLELQTAIEMIRRGADDYIVKPFSRATIEERLETAVQEWRSRLLASQTAGRLQRLVDAMTEKLLATNERIEAVCDMAVAALGSALDLRDPETHEHCRRVAGNSVRLGAAMGLGERELRNLRWSSYLHDIGKIGIPDHILAKPDALTAREQERIREHPLLGFRMISGVEFLRDATDVVLYHHEKYDGSGYPYGLKGQQIPLAARVFAVADAEDAMLHDRPYRPALSASETRAEIVRESGRHFDPAVVKNFLGISNPPPRDEDPSRASNAKERAASAREAISPARRHAWLTA